AMIAQRFMYETGATVEDFAAVCVSNRKWAQLHPDAMFRSPLTEEEVLASKMICSPFRKYMVNRLADKASAFVMASSSRARELTRARVYFIGEGRRCSVYPLPVIRDPTRMGYVEAGELAYKMAGLRPSDIDIVELYDAYPVFPMIQLEALGFCERGTSGEF